MSAMSELHEAIVHLLDQGHDPEAVAESLGISLDMVMAVLDDLRMEDEVFASINDLSDDEDALSSAGHGMDESYVIDNDYFDEY